MHLPGTNALRSALSSLSFLERAILGALFAVLIVSVIAMLVDIQGIFTRIVPSRGGHLTEGIVGTPRFINPVIARSEADKDLVALVYSGLMRPTPQGDLIPDLAEEYSVSSEGTTYTFTLKKGMTFHDGKPVTADDVVYTVGQIQNPLLGSPLLRAWEGVQADVVDEYTVSFKLPKPYVQFIENTTVGILPKHLWNETDEETFPIHRLNSEPVGTGPFKVEKIARDNSGIPASYELERFSDFALGAPYLESITMTMYGNDRDVLEAYLDGDIDAVHNIDPADAAALASEGERVETYALPRTFGVFFNQNRKELFIDEPVRSALAAAIDPQSVIDEVLYGYGTPLAGPLPPPLPGRAIKDARTIQAAEQILEDAGWAKGDDGIYAKKTARLAFTLTTANTEELKHTAEVLKRAWGTLGAEVTLEFFDLGALHQSVIRPRTYDALLFGQVIGRGGDLYPFWHSSQRNDPGLNIALYANIAVDAILEDIRTTLDPSTREDLYESLESEIIEENPAVFLYAPHFLCILPKNIKGVTAGPIDEASERFMNVYEWHTDTHNVLTASPSSL